MSLQIETSSNLFRSCFPRKNFVSWKCLLGFLMRQCHKKFWAKKVKITNFLFSRKTRFFFNIFEKNIHNFCTKLFKSINLLRYYYDKLFLQPPTGWIWKFSQNPLFPRERKILQQRFSCIINFHTCGAQNFFSCNIFTCSGCDSGLLSALYNRKLQIIFIWKVEAANTHSGSCKLKKFILQTPNTP